MNREIKFRGRHKISGKWYYGYLFKRKNAWIITSNGFTEYVVDSNTVGEYTGLKDKNGKEIYKGDAVEFYGDYCIQEQFGLRKAMVKWDNDDLCFYLDSDADRMTFDQNKDGLEVIGNIYENPNLLEK